jgi:hypothetical protein
MIILRAITIVLLFACELVNGEMQPDRIQGGATNTFPNTQKWALICGGSAIEPVWTVTKIRRSNQTLKGEVSFARACKVLLEGINIDAIIVATNVQQLIISNRLGIFCEPGSNVCITANNIVRKTGDLIGHDPKVGTMGLDLLPTASMVGRMNRHVGFARNGDRYVCLESNQVDRRQRLINLLNNLSSGSLPQCDELIVIASDNDITSYVKQLFGSLGINLLSIRVDPRLLWIVFETSTTANVVGVGDFISDPIAAPEMDFNAPFEVYERSPPVIDE